MEYVLRGKYLDEFSVGQQFVSPARTIAEADVACFAGLTGDYNPLHTNEEFAKEHSIFKTRIAHGLLGLSIMSGQLNQLGMMEGTTIAFIESTDKFVGPIRIGSTVVTKATVSEIKFSSKPGKGILKFEVELVDQDDNVAIKQSMTLMMKTKDVLSSYER